MSRNLSWNDEYCPNGHKWVFCPASSLYPDYYYCEEEDLFYEPTVKEVSVTEIAKNYNGDRPNEMLEYALFNEALQKLRYRKWSDVIVFAEDKK